MIHLCTCKQWLLLASEASETLSGHVQLRFVVCIYICIYAYLVCVTYFFARASNFTRWTVSWGGFMMGTWKRHKKWIRRWSTLLFSIDFSDYDTTVVSQLSLRSLWLVHLKLITSSPPNVSKQRPLSTQKRQ